MATYKLTIEYDGTRYSGWQVQKNTARTVQGQLLNAAADAFGEADLGGGGRTDAGVHAFGQAAHLRIRRSQPPERIAHALNDRLPFDIHVSRVEPARDNFHARHDASSRIYLYQISTRRSAFAKPYVWWIKDRLDSGAMSLALPKIIGMHDFINFSDRRLVAGESTKVLLEFAELGVSDDLILIRLSASHFLWKMVRKLIAALAEVGRGNLTPDEFAELLNGDEPFAPTAPPSGLFLEAITYDGEIFDRPLEPLVPVFTYAPARKGKWDAGKTRS